MAETHELRLKINAGAAKAGAAEFRGALKSIQKAVQELDRTSDGAFTSLRTGTKDAATATASATDRVATSSKTAGDRIKQMALASASALRTSQNEAQRLAERFQNLGDTQALTRLNTELAQLKTNLTNAQSGLDVRAARSGFADTSAELKRYANNLDAAARAERQAAEASRNHASQMEQLAHQYDPIRAVSKRYETDLANIQRLESAGAISAARAAQARETAAQSLLAASAATDQYNAALGRNAAATQQGIMVGHQLSDVLITAQMGFQSVGMIALQQGSQLASQMNTLKASGGSVFRTLLAGFTSLLSPLTLITIAGTAAFAAIMKWAFSAGEETKDFSDALSDANTHINALRSASDALATNNLSALRREYGAVNEELRIHLERLQKVAEIEARDVNRNMIDSIRDTLTSDGNPFTGSVDEIRRAFDTTNDSARRLLAIMDDIRSAATFDEQAQKISALRAEVERVTGGLDRAEGAALEVLLQLIKSEDAAKKLAAAQDGTADATHRSASAASGLATNLGTAADAARQLLATMGAVPGAVAALGRSVDAQIASMQAQNESLSLQLNVGLSSEAANRRVQLNVLLKSGGLTPDAAAKEFDKITQLDALAKAQEDLRKRLSEANKPAKSGGGGGGARVEALGDESRQLAKLSKQMNNRLFQIGQENEALKLLVSGQTSTKEGAELMAAAMALNGGVIDETTMAMIRQHDAAARLNGQLQRTAAQSAQAWRDSAPSWAEASEQIKRDGLENLSQALSDFLVTGEMSLDRFFDAIHRSLADLAAQSIVGSLSDAIGLTHAPSGGGTGFWEGFSSLVAGIFHEGGVSHAPTSTRRIAVSPAAVAAAPRYHSGTPNTGLTTGEHIAVLRDNEAVVPLSGGRTIPVDLNGAVGAGGGMVINMPQTFQINTPDADSFRRSKSQILQETGAATRKAMAKNG